MSLRVSKEDFVKKYIRNLKEKYDKNSIVIKTLKEDAESLYDQVTEHGVILMDESELRKRFSLCDKCNWKDKCREVRLDKEEVCPDLLAPHEVLKEILGENENEG